MYEVISNFLKIENNFDKNILSNEKVELYINKNDAKNYSEQILDMAENWNNLPLILDEYNHIINYKKDSFAVKLVKKLFRKI
tara:strand:+ start:1829 stop:2074 length:246 start_codon:yes stop_codon:yes gene_type:complete